MDKLINIRSICAAIFLVLLTTTPVPSLAGDIFKGYIPCTKNGGCKNEAGTKENEEVGRIGSEIPENYGGDGQGEGEDGGGGIVVVPYVPSDDEEVREEDSALCEVTQPGLENIFIERPPSENIPNDCSVIGCRGGNLVEKDDDGDISTEDKQCKMCDQGSLQIDPAKEGELLANDMCHLCTNGSPTEIEFDKRWREVSYAGNDRHPGVTVIADKVNLALTSIGLSDYVEFSELKYAHRESACCKSDTGVIEDGNVERTVTLGIAINKGGKEFLLYGLPAIDEEFDFGVAILELDIAAGFYFSVSSTIEVAGGGVTSQCSSEEECLKASASLSLDFALIAKIEAIACFDSWWSNKACAGFTIIPAAVSTGLEGGLFYNKNCGEGLSGSLSTKDVVFTAKLGLDLPGAGELSLTRQVYGGIQIYP